LDPVLLYGVLELTIGLFALLPGSAVEWIQVVDARVHRDFPALATPFTVLALVLTTGPATFAMGATLPVMGLLARAVGNPLSRLYALNTAGAATGTLVVAFALIPSLGLRHASYFLFFTHLVLASLCLALSRKKRRPPAASKSPPEETSARATLPGT